MSQTVIVDDRDPSVVCEGSWVQLNLAPQYNKSSRGSQLPGSKCTLNFTGTSVTVVTTVSKGKPFSLEFELDGITTTNSSIGINDVAGDVYSFHDATFSQANLSDGEHQLVVTYAQAPESIGIYLDYFLYTTSPTTNLSGVNLFIDDRDPSVIYLGDWRADTADAQFGHTAHTADNTSSSSLAVTFEGIGIQLFGLDPYVDVPDPLSFMYKIDSGVTHVIVNLPGELTEMGWYNWMFIDSGLLSPGVHTLTVTARSKHAFWIDYILVKQPIILATQTPALESSSSISASNSPTSAITSTTGFPTIAPASSESAAPSSGSHSLRGAIAGGTVAGILALALIALSFVLLRMRRRHRAVAETKIDLAEERPYAYSSLALPLDHPPNTTDIEMPPIASIAYLPHTAQSSTSINAEPYSAARPDLAVTNPTDDDAVSGAQRRGFVKAQPPRVRCPSCSSLGLVSPPILSPASYTDTEASGRRWSDVEAWVDDLPPSYER
ncbi:hypothetical protein HGRIS_005183 [Hohenbuehelia grisea]|uniref:Transmembrane protein n=1 Tax=Hohenbuehelia grisea TaxID=104357 RepID=A0ABR3JEA3_9AGAR